MDKETNDLVKRTPATDRITRPDPKPIQYQLFVRGVNGIIVHWIYDYQCNHVDLVDLYKSALLTGDRYIVWSNGILNTADLLGVTKQQL